MSERSISVHQSPDDGRKIVPDATELYSGYVRTHGALAQMERERIGRSGLRGILRDVISSTLLGGNGKRWPDRYNDAAYSAELAAKRSLDDVEANLELRTREALADANRDGVHINA